MLSIPHGWLIGLAVILMVPAWKLLKLVLYPSMKKLQEYTSILYKTKKALQSLQVDLKVITQSRDAALEEVRNLKEEYNSQITQFNTELQALRTEIDKLK